MRRPSAAKLRQAALWLDCNCGEDGEAESCQEVMKWLESLADKADDETVFRQVARDKGVSVAFVRKVMKKAGK